MGSMTSGSMFKFWHILVLHNFDLFKKIFFLICVFYGNIGMGNHHGISTFWDEIKVLMPGLLSVTLRDLRKTPEIFPA